MFIPKKIKNLATEIEQSGGRLFVVGGAVRDHFMGVTPVDFDLLIIGLSEPEAMVVLNNPKKVIGNAPVFMWQGEEVALGRREISTGLGKHEFEFVADRRVTLLEDLARRDFTFNAMAVDVLTGKVFDPFGGFDDLTEGLINPVSEAFMESPERVLRGASFASRFDFDLSAQFVQFSGQMTMNAIPAEQVWRHFVKAMGGVKPSRWLVTLQETGWIRFFPELENLVGLPQDPTHHPEIYVFEHTCHVVDEAHGEIGRLAAICHDLGKVGTTFVENGVIKSPKHAMNLAPTETFLTRIGCFEIETRKVVLNLVREHMVHLGATPSRKMVRRLSQRLAPATVKQWADLVTADVSGRPPRPKHTPENVLQMVQIANSENLTEKPFKGLMQGRHLIQLGLKPSPAFGELLKQAETAEVNGEFDNVADGLEFLEGLL